MDEPHFYAPPPREHPCDLYLISPQDVTGDFAARLKDAVQHERVSAFQLRVKGMKSHDLARAAEPLQEICAEADVAFIVNDDVAMCKRLGADGVHLGQGDGNAKEARAILGPSKQIGVTCHASRHLAMQAGEQGADYVAFGSFYPSQTKASEHRPEPTILSWWANLFELPCVAIGGITPDNAEPLVRAGADFLAVSQSVWGAEDVAKAVAAFDDVLAGSLADR
ncbi:thiamine phosphate synthase [Sphingomicrobium sediminis]|uniref:Thiamine-phosphate synthase n=1 Tax=Sphingomicrobium sediminis TaxID=2950949 RepID=A0A9X2EFK6_9SPHN|nr:thiamine phosphate synthase [Sphingomicrobium sediminis]MCM8557043.1 thiamine phosphate synthase [Sphingomicrobium sediminis]